MLKPIIEYVKSARFEAPPELPLIALSRPVWADGTDYDIPTYLRRDRSRRRHLVRHVPVAIPRPSAGADLAGKASRMLTALSARQHARVRLEGVPVPLAGVELAQADVRR